VTLRELLEQSDLPEGAEQLLEVEPLTQEEKRRILALTLAKAGVTPMEKKEKPRMKKNRFGLLLMAGVLCAGAVVASAAGYFTVRNDLARHLDAGENEQALVSQAGLDIGESCTVDGWTITAAQALGDQTQIRILLDVTAPEGTVLKQGHYRLEVPQLEPLTTFTFDEVEDDDPTDNKMSFVISTIPDKDYRGETVKLHIGGISRYKDHTAEERLAGADPFDRDELIKGDFDLSFKVDYQDTSVTYKPGAEVDTAGGKVKVEEVRLSPLSVVVKLSGEGTKVKEPGFATGADPDLEASMDGGESGGKDWTAYTVQDGAASAFGENGGLRSEFGVTVEVKDKNGSVIPWTTGDTEPDSVTMTFAGIIDPADVASIVVNGVEIPLTE